MPHNRDTDIMANVTIDRALTICRSAGPMGDRFKTGTNVLDAMPYLVGYEPDLLELVERTGAPLIIHNIALMNGSAGSEPVHVTLSARAVEGSRVTIELRDIGEVAELQARLLQKHNELALTFDELNRARIAAEEAARSKSAFIANISHELRTPLNVIIGNAELLARYRSQFDAEELDLYANDIRKSGRYLLELVNDLLDLAKSDAGRLALAEDVCDFGTIVENAINLVQGLPAAQNIRFAVVPPYQPVTLWADSKRLKQVLINLLSNAIKFSPASGLIEVSYEASPESGMICEVTDQGPGMPAEEIKRVMEPFVQGTAPKRGEAGTGLGLTMVQTLIDLHQGTFGLDPGNRGGTIARFTLPAARVTSSTGASRS